ncbi:MAG: dynamin family protein [Desulfobacterales bacterium]|nr:dynamin family protein [Desulfobacterales bacterium]
MTQKKTRLKTIDALVSDTLSIIQTMADVPDMFDPALEGFRENCQQIPDHIASGYLKIAVVGVIKSGKSTFINAMAGKELVKRGAGVVTAITTRIRKGKKNQARLTLKSWDEINGVLRKNLDMFSDDPQEREFIEGLDLRRKKDRAFLTKTLKKLKSEFPVVDQGIRPETLSIQNALEGYEDCKDIVQADEAELVYSSKAFEKHKNFTADSSHAFFVKDVCLEIFGSTLNLQVEIADCQGADSTDPAQLAQVIQYLESANLIIYCISSRTGLRKSDMEFLKTINRMGLLENIIFVNNCDLSEHENLANLKAIEANIKAELEFLMDSPRLYSFSALFDLFENLGSKLTKRNGKRLELWQDDKAMAEFCRKNSAKFKGRFEELLEGENFKLLVSNHLERLELMLESMGNKTDLFLKLTSTDDGDRCEAGAQLEYVRENAERLKSIVDNSLEGAISGLVREVEKDLKQLFSQGSDSIQARMKSQIIKAPMDVEPYRPQVKETGFKQILYFMFQDFKRDLDLFLVREIIPDIKAKVNAQEKRISTYFQSLLDSYRIDPMQWSRDGKDTGLEEISQGLGRDKVPSETGVDIQAIKKILGLELPPPLFSPRFTKRMRANAVTGLSLHSVGLLVKSFFKKQVRFSFTPGFKQAGDSIKRESLTSFKLHIQEYEKQLFSTYFMPLIEAVTRDFKEKIHDRFAIYESLNQDLDRLYALKQEEMDGRRDVLLDIKARIQDCLDRLDTL